MIEKLVQVRKVTEFRDDSIYKTEFVRESWVDINAQMYQVNEDGEMYCSLPTSRLAEVNHKTLRNVHKVTDLGYK